MLISVPHTMLTLVYEFPSSYLCFSILDHVTLVEDAVIPVNPTKKLHVVPDNVVGSDD